MARVLTCLIVLMGLALSACSNAADEGEGVLHGTDSTRDDGDGDTSPGAGSATADNPGTADPIAGDGTSGSSDAPSAAGEPASGEGSGSGEDSAASSDGAMSAGTSTPGDGEAGDADSDGSGATTGDGAPASSEPAPGDPGAGDTTDSVGVSDEAAPSSDRDGDATTGEPVQSGQLTAGEWNDLDHWDFWLGLGDGDCQQVDCEPGVTDAPWGAYWGYDTRGRVAVHVTHQDAPVVDAAVRLESSDGEVLWRARTDNEGDAELFVGLFVVPGQQTEPAQDRYRVVVQAGGETVSVEDVDPAQGASVEMPAPYAPEPSLDLMFVIDTTGSMSDELRYIQAELADVIDRVREQLAQQLSVRLSVNFYRDVSDLYTVRPFPFTSDIAQATEDLAAQSAGGGGDYPEAVEQALADAIDGHQWRSNATARLLVLVLDAPPHYTDPILEQLHDSTRSAASQGVQIVPLSGSGIDQTTEMLLRALAISTNGTYTFLTDDSGIGGSHLEPTIGDYEVEQLNDLLVRVITEAL